MKSFLLVSFMLLVSLITKSQTHPICFNSLNNAPLSTVSSNNYNSMVTLDFNHDGKMDLAAASYNGVSILLGAGTGSFTIGATQGISSNIASIVSADFNNDGEADFAVSNYANNCATVLLNTGSGSFATPVNYFAGTNPTGVTIADFNNDGNPDMAVSNSGSNNVSVLLGSASGVFSPAVNYSVATSPSDIKSADFNNDGKMDLAVTNSFSGNLSILIGSGIGTFNAATNYPVGISPESLITGDYNSDGKADVITVNRSSHNISVLLGNGSGAFATPVNYGAGTNPLDISSADFNNDGIIDLAVVNDENIYIFKGAAAGIFIPGNNYGTGTNPICIAPGNFNMDGNTDLAVGKRLVGSVSVLFGEGTTSFGAHINYGTLFDPVGIASADFNNDGFQDLAAVNKITNTISVMLAIGTGSFSAVVNYTVGTTPIAILSADFNLDGKVDLAVLNNASNNVSILLGNGTGGFATAVNYPTGPTPLSFTSADFNLDGNMDLAILNTSYPTISTLLGSPSGAFSSSINGNTMGFNGLFITSGDFNSDGTPDLAITTSGGNPTANGYALVETGNGDGTFAYFANSTVGVNPKFHINADFNNDGKRDIVVLNNGSYMMSILLATPSGTFASPSNYNLGISGNYAIAGVASDFNNDGNLDLAIVNSTKLFILEGSGTGSFTTTAIYDVGTSPVALTSKDFNNDGRQDLAVCNFSSRDVSILLNGMPAVTLSSISSAICPGTPVSITASGAITYSWSTGTTTNTIGISPTTTTNYSVTGSTYFGCKNTAVTTVSVIPGITINSGAICAGQSFTLNPSGASTYTYVTGAAIVTPTSTSSYSITGTHASGCVSSAVSTVNVNALPIVSVNSGSLCIGKSYTITPTGASTYTIQAGSAIVSPTVNTSYTVTGTSSAGCISAISATANITVNPSPTVSVNSGTICRGQSFTFTPTGAATYTYPGGYSIVNPTASATYTISGANAFGCTALAVSHITVNPLPVISVNSGSICAGSSFNIVPSGASTYTIQGGSALVSPAITTNYTVAGTSSVGCVSQSYATSHVVVDICTGIENQNSSVNNDLLVYPNPNNGTFYISYNISEPLELKLYNSNGQLTLTQTLAGDRKFVILNNIPSGIYHYSISTKTGIHKGRIVVE